MTNALAHESSPYLRQHAENPVDWLPWSEDTLARARALDRPLFVSIGYAACHWCHVMERESFEDSTTAALMNERFVCVKVDREERPDIDGIYMEAVQLLTGQGGWPLNVFLTPEQTPFFGGTYWPPERRHGMASFKEVLELVSSVWTERRGDALEVAARLTAQIGRGAAREATGDTIGEAELAEALTQLRRSFDPVNGGFGGAPKFPPHCALELLLRGEDPDLALATLRSMARGGIHDQVGGGFARYAVDRSWTVPHFEKMLYDNALLARAYLHGWQRSGDALLLRTARETIEFCLRELRDPQGGFYSSLDADSDGVEGRFYVWSVEQLHAALGDRAQAAIAYFGATQRGNFDGANVLLASGPEPAERDAIRAALLEARERRVRPGLDRKRLAAWNALMIAALADAGSVLEEPRYLDAAIATSEFVWSRLRDANGRLLRSYNDRAARLPAYLEDHAFLLEALLTLYEATFQERFFVWARELADTILEHFADTARGGFFATADDAEPLITRRKDLEDQPIPSGSSSAALGLLRLGALTGEARYERAAAGAIALAADVAPRVPASFAYLLCAAAFQAKAVVEVALVGPDLAPLRRAVRSEFRPHLVLAGSPDGGASAVPLLAGRSPAEGGASAAYVCERFACKAPVSEPRELAALLDQRIGR